jgi:hypothetical protein
MKCIACGKSYLQEVGHGCGDTLLAAELRIQIYDLQQKLVAAEFFQKTRKTVKIQEELDIRKCDKPGHPHFDMRWGCPMCRPS